MTKTKQLPVSDTAQTHTAPQRKRTKTQKEKRQYKEDHVDSAHVC